MSNREAHAILLVGSVIAIIVVGFAVVSFFTLL